MSHSLNTDSSISATAETQTGRKQTFYTLLLLKCDLNQSIEADSCLRSSSCRPLLGLIRNCKEPRKGPYKGLKEVSNAHFLSSLHKKCGGKDEMNLKHCSKVTDFQMHLPLSLLYI